MMAAEPGAPAGAALTQSTRGDKISAAQRQSLAPLTSTAPAATPPAATVPPRTRHLQEAQNSIPRSGKCCKVLESAQPLNFAFNICSPINLCLLSVNCALLGLQFTSPSRCPRQPRGSRCQPGPSPRGAEGAAGTRPGQPRPWRPPAPLCARTPPLSRPSLGFFLFCFNCFQNRFHVVPK